MGPAAFVPGDVAQQDARATRGPPPHPCKATAAAAFVSAASAALSRSPGMRGAKAPERESSASSGSADGEDVAAPDSPWQRRRAPPAARTPANSAAEMSAPAASLASADGSASASPASSRAPSFDMHRQLPRSAASSASFTTLAAEAAAAAAAEEAAAGMAAALGAPDTAGRADSQGLEGPQERGGAAQADAEDLRPLLQHQASALAAAQSGLAAAQSALAASEAALDDERRAAALLLRQVQALRLVLAERASDAESHAKAAAGRECELVLALSAAKARADAAAAQSEAAARAASEMRRDLSEARRALRALTGSASGELARGGEEGERAAARELVIQHRAEVEAEERAEGLAAVLVEREEELTYYRRHCAALEERVRDVETNEAAGRAQGRGGGST